MIFSPEQSQALQDLRVYTITVSGHKAPRHVEGEDPWAGKELTMAVTLHGYGDNAGNCAPTWQSSGHGENLAEAFDKALLFAPAQREKANAVSRNALHEVLPEYDPDGTRFRKTRTPRTKRAAGPKVSLDDLMKLGI
jgi:hypothetical protein